ncbi:MAG: dihydroorotate dehydrogenase [Candidatus Gastranaerophilales bacterium]|nr:dihydroorotate dehydrogenase [Candidatus Gastranaerophilales bacterium]
MAVITGIMQTNLNGLILKNPIMTASGTYGYADEYNDFIDVSNIGAIVTKAISLKPGEGNKHLRIAETKAGMINSIGLENVGIEKFLEIKLPVLKSNNIEFIVNIAGSAQEEYVELAKICSENKIKAIELNVSCPNVKSGCLEFGTDENSLYKLVSSVRREYGGFLIVKLTPNVTSIEKIGLAAQKAGADAISAINTLKGMSIKLNIFNGKINKTIVQGGYSGTGIKPVAISAVNRLYKTVDIPIIGIGGIETLDDVLEFFAAGAQAVQIGTANFTHPETAEKLVFELQSFIEKNGFRNLDELKNELRK